MKIIPALHPAAGVFALFLLASDSWAQKTFTATNGNWNSSSNWSTTGVPTSQEVRIGTTSTHRTANISSANATSGLASIGYSSGHRGTVNVSNSRLWNLGTSALYVGNSGIGTLNLTGGGKVTSSGAAVLAREVGSQGTASLNGAGSSWTSGNIYVGQRGAGLLTISDGGTVGTFSGGLGIIGRYNGSTGAVNVTGVDSVFAVDNLTIGNVGRGEVTIDNGGRVSNSTGYIGREIGSLGAVSISGEGSTWINSRYLYVGNAGTGELTVDNGGYIQSGFYEPQFFAAGISRIGSSTGGHGAVTITGTGSLWSIFGEIRVGELGAGTLLIENGGRVSSQVQFDNYSWATIGSQNGSGSVTVSGEGSTWSYYSGIRVGATGLGTLNIEDGGRVWTRRGEIASSLGGTGEATVSGANSTWANSFQISVGHRGTGTLVIEAGGAVTSMFASIGYNESGNGDVLVTGTDSLWANSSSLTVGVLGTGVLHITSGGSVTNTSGYIGLANGSSGTVNVNGAGSVWINAGDLILGGSDLTTQTTGTGALTIQGAGSVWIGGTLRIYDGDSVTLDGGTIRFDGYNRNAAGTFDYQSGTVQLAGDRTVGSDTAISDLFGATPTIGAGKGLTIEGTATLDTTLTLDGGTFISNGINNLANLSFSSGTLEVNGAVTGDMIIPELSVLTGSTTITGNLNNSGVVSPGNSPGTITVDGNYVQELTGLLEIEIGGTGVGLYDVLAVTGDATLGGNLGVSMFNDFELGYAQIFPILTVGGTLGGQFIGLGEGALVGTFSGTDLFITYSPDFSGVALFTAVPEPSVVAAGLVVVLGLIVMLRRKRIKP